MTDITSPTLIWIKGLLFLVLGLIASLLLILRAGDVAVVLLLCLAVWAFCRFYYFAFYVIQHYVDPTYRYSGLLSFVRYLLSKRCNRGRDVT